MKEHLLMFHFLSHRLVKYAMKMEQTVRLLDRMVKE